MPPAARRPSRPAFVAAAATVVLVTVGGWLAGLVAAVGDCSTEGSSTVTEADRRTVACLDRPYAGTWGQVQDAIAWLAVPVLAVTAVLVIVLARRRGSLWPMLVQPVLSIGSVVAFVQIGHVTVATSTATFDDVGLRSSTCSTRGGTPACRDGLVLAVRLSTETDVGLRLRIHRRRPRTRAESDAAIARPPDPSFDAAVAGRDEVRGGPHVADRVYRLPRGVHLLRLLPTRVIERDPARPDVPDGHAPLPSGRYDLELQAWAADDPNAAPIRRELLVVTR